MTTLLQRYGQGKFREVSGLQPITASGGGECFPVTDEDVALGIVCMGCEHTFELGGYYARRLIGEQGEYEIMEVVCLTCAEMTAPATEGSTTEAPASYGQDRDLPDPEGWIPATIPVVCVEGYPTGDHRLIPVDALQGHRALPLALMSLSTTGMGGHEGATLSGRIDHLERVPGPSVINVDTGEPFPEGTFVWTSNEAYVNPDHPDYPWMRNGALNGISVDLSETEADYDFDEETGEETMVLRTGRIAAATVCTMPAFPGAYIVLDPSAAAVEKPEGEPIAASGAGFRLETEALCASCSAPSAAWFRDPHLTEPTPLTVTDEGQVFGHVTAWDVCHIGLPGCVKAPRSASGYAYYLTGSVLTDDGQQVPVGRITLGTGHADLSLGLAAATEHYDHTGAAVADVTAGEDEFGIWVAGAVRPGVTDEQLRALRASPPSGDWRPIGGQLEMVGVLCVNTPGFPIPRPRARVAAGVPVALVAAGTLPKEVPVADDAPPAEIRDGEVVTIGDTGLQGVVTLPPGDDGTATVEVVVDASMLTPVDAPEEAPADPEMAGVKHQLRVLQADRLISRIL